MDAATLLLSGGRWLRPEFHKFKYRHTLTFKNRSKWKRCGCKRIALSWHNCWKLGVPGGSGHYSPYFRMYLKFSIQKEVCLFFLLVWAECKPARNHRYPWRGRGRSLSCQRPPPLEAGAQLWLPRQPHSSAHPQKSVAGLRDTP